jgi:hypothetical protein
MPLPKEVKDRIWKDGINFSADVKQRVSYINGAAKEAERSQKLVAGLEQVVRCCEAAGHPMDRIIQDIWEGAKKSLNEYNQQP